MVKVTGKKNGVSKTKTLKATVTVKPVEINAVSEEATMTVGDTLSESDLFTKKPLNKTLKYKSSNETVATVDSNGTVTAVGAGTATITASSVYAEESASVDVTVTAAELVLTDVKQASTTTLTATFSGDASDITKSDITITNDATTKNVSVKSVDLDSTDTTNATLTITAYTSMADGNSYTVAYGESTANFTATDGTVASITVDPVEITYGTETEIDAVLKDKNDVLLAELKYGITVYNDLVLEFTIDDITSGYTTSDGLCLSEIGDTAVANVTLHSGVYDTSTGKETGNIESGDITITAVEQASVTGWDKIYSTGDVESYSAATATKIAVGDESAYAYLQMTLSNNTTTTDISDYTFESSNDDVMTVSVVDATNGKIFVSANETGTASIIVKDTNGNAVTALSLTIYAAREAGSLELSTSSVDLSTATAGAVAIETAEVAATVYDQYGEIMKDAKVETEVTTTDSDNGNSDTLGQAAVVDENNVITVDVTTASGVKLKTKTGGTIKLSVKVSATEGGSTVSKTLTVNAKTPTYETEGSYYEVALTSSKADAVITSTATGDTTVTACVYGYDKNDVKMDIVTGAAFEITQAGSDASDAEGSSNYEGSVTWAAIHVNDVSEGKCMENGTYTVKPSATTGGSINFANTFASGVTFGAIKTTSAKLTVTNSQSMPTASVESITMTTSQSLNDIITISCSGATDKIKITGYSTANGSYITDKITETGKVYIKTVDVEVPLGNNKLVTTVDVKKNITVSN